MGSSTGIFTPYMALALTRDNRRSIEGEDMPIHPLLIGQKITAGTAVAGTVQEVTSLTDVEVLAGRGSHLYMMAKAYFERRSTTRISIGVMTDPATATKAKITVTFTATATHDVGMVYLNIMGDRYALSHGVAETAADLATALVSAINADTSRYYTAAAATGVVTITVNNAGIAMGGIPCVVNPEAGQKCATGISSVVGTEAAGTGTTDQAVLTNLLASIGETQYALMFGPYNDSASIALINMKLADLSDPLNARDAFYLTNAPIDTVANLITLAGTTKSKYIHLYDMKGWLSNPSQILGTMAREFGISAKKDINKPLHNVVLTNRVGPVRGTQRVWEDRNNLAKFGIAGLNPDKLTVESPVSTWTATAEERRLENLLNLAALRYSFDYKILKDFDRAKMKKGDEAVQTGQIIMTPSVGETAAISWYAKKIFAGQVEDMDFFQSNLQVTISDVDTVTWYLPVTLVGQFVVGTGTLNYMVGGN